MSPVHQVRSAPTSSRCGLSATGFVMPSGIEFMGFCFLSLSHEVASKESFMRKYSLLLLGLGTWVGSFAQAQLGVSPSQSSGLLRELRARAGEVTKEDPLGKDRLLLDQSRSLTNPSALSDSNAGATRLRWGSHRLPEPVSGGARQPFSLVGHADEARG